MTRPDGSASAPVPVLPLNLDKAAGQIRHLHEQAQTRARQSVSLAKEAGHHLLAVKATLKHGEFIPWVEQNCHVSARQVQRYMAAAKGRLPPARKLLDERGTSLPNATDQVA